MRPHGHFGGAMHKPKVTRLALYDLPCVALVDVDMEKRVVMSAVIILWPGREFLIGRHQRRCNVVGEQVRLCIDM